MGSVGHRGSVLEPKDALVIELEMALGDAVQHSPRRLVDLEERRVEAVVRRRCAVFHVEKTFELGGLEERRPPLPGWIVGIAAIVVYEGGQC